VTRAAAAVVLAAGVGLAADPPAAVKELQGAWVLHAATLAGRDHLDDFAGMTLTVTGETYAIDFGENSDKGTLTVDAAKSPKWIDVTTRKDGPFKGRTLPGIFKLDGGKLVLCLDSEAKARPTAFEAKEKTSVMLLTYARAKK
jgi:uncharacterized protein (TIGR03067 family)